MRRLYWTELCAETNLCLPMDIKVNVRVIKYLIVSGVWLVLGCDWKMIILFCLYKVYNPYYK